MEPEKDPANVAIADPDPIIFPGRHPRERHREDQFHRAGPRRDERLAGGLCHRRSPVPAAERGDDISVRAGGMSSWGINIPIAWAYAITNFVWWIGIGHAGTLISAFLLLMHQRWRTSINRFAEAMTIFAVMCAGMFPLAAYGPPVDVLLFAALTRTQCGCGRSFAVPLCGTYLRYRLT